MSENWISRVHDACNEIDRNARALAHWADALDTVGLERPANSIGAIADELIRAQKAIKDACGDELSDSLRNAQEGTAGLLKLAMAGALRRPMTARNENQTTNLS